jgi:hypothetical protein
MDTIGNPIALKCYYKTLVPINRPVKTDKLTHLYCIGTINNTNINDSSGNGATTSKGYSSGYGSGTGGCYGRGSSGSSGYSSGDGGSDGTGCGRGSGDGGGTGYGYGSGNDYEDEHYSSGGDN